MPHLPPERISRADIARLRTLRVLPNLLKMPLFIALMAALGWSAWTTGSVALPWLDYAAFGYLWMSIVTIMQIGRASCRERVCQYVLFSLVAVSFNYTISSLSLFLTTYFI